MSLRPHVSRVVGAVRRWLGPRSDRPHDRILSIARSQLLTAAVGLVLRGPDHWSFVVFFSLGVGFAWSGALLRACALPEEYDKDPFS